MIVVADSSPLNILIHLGYESLLAKMYDRIVAPPEVVEELTHANTPPDVSRVISAGPAWLEVRSPTTLLPLDLGRGERAAISLAVELDALLMIDEQTGRSAAMARGLTIIGAVGVLEAAADFGLIEDLAAVHAALQATDFRISQTLLDQSLARYKARRRS